MLWLKLGRRTRLELVRSWMILDRSKEELMAFRAAPKTRRNTTRAWRLLLVAARYDDARAFYADPGSNFELSCGVVNPEVTRSRLRRYLTPPCNLHTIVESIHTYMMRPPSPLGARWYAESFPPDSYKDEAAEWAAYVINGGLVVKC